MNTDIDNIEISMFYIKGVLALAIVAAICVDFVFQA